MPWSSRLAFVGPYPYGRLVALACGGHTCWAVGGVVSAPGGPLTIEPLVLRIPWPG